MFTMSLDEMLAMRQALNLLIAKALKKKTKKRGNP